MMMARRERESEMERASERAAILHSLVPPNEGSGLLLTTEQWKDGRGRWEMGMGVKSALPPMFSRRSLPSLSLRKWYKCVTGYRPTMPQSQLRQQPPKSAPACTTIAHTADETSLGRLAVKIRIVRLSG